MHYTYELESPVQTVPDTPGIGRIKLKQSHNRTLSKSVLQAFCIIWEGSTQVAEEDEVKRKRQLSDKPSSEMQITLNYIAWKKTVNLSILRMLKWEGYGVKEHGLTAFECNNESKTQPRRASLKVPFCNSVAFPIWLKWFWRATQASKLSALPSL